MSVTLARFTVEDYHRLIEAGGLSHKPVELLDGLIVEMPPEGPLHYSLGDNFADWLKIRLEGRAKVRFDGPITLENSEPEPDIAVVRIGDYKTHHPYAQEVYWVLEFANTSLEKDLHEKLAVYARAKIPEYWVVNLKADEIIVCSDPRDNQYQQRQVYTAGSLSSFAFPDLQVAVSMLLGK